MKRTQLSIEEIKEKTKELLGLSDDDDLSYVDEDYAGDDVAQPMEDIDPATIPSPNYGTRISYGHRDGVGPTYEFYGGRPGWATTPGQACSGGRWWLSQSLWNHDNLDQYCGGSGPPAYRRIARFTYNP